MTKIIEENKHTSTKTKLHFIFMLDHSSSMNFGVGVTRFFKTHKDVSDMIVLQLIADLKYKLTDDDLVTCLIHNAKVSHYFTHTIAELKKK